MKNQLTLVCILALLFAANASAQQKDFQWRLGVSMGYTNYVGDLTPVPAPGTSRRGEFYHIFNYNNNYATQPSFKATLEKQLSPSTGLSLHFGQYYFGMSDRYVDRNGYLYLENPNFPRSLNFTNRTKEIGISAVFRSDNDRLLPSKALIAPYFSVGLGILHFDVWGDLLDQNGEKYDNSIPGIIHDGLYETSLPEWETELNGGYGQVTLTSTLGLGFRVRLTRHLEAFAQSDLILTFSDFLDDVSGRYRDEFSSSFQEYASKPGFNVVDPEKPYRGNPNGQSDKIFFHGIGLKYNFGASKKSFRGPRVSAGFVQVSGQVPSSSLSLEDELPRNTPVKSFEERATSTDQLLVWQKIQKLDTIKYENQLLTWNQEIQKRENLSTAGKVKERNLVQVQAQMEKQYQNLLDDKSIPEAEKDGFLRATDQNRFNVRYSLDSLRRKERELAQEIDSISRLKRDHRLIPTVMVVYADTVNNRSSEEIAPAPELADKTVSTETEQSTETKAVSTTSEVSRNSAAQSQMALSPEEQERIKNLEEENRYLQYERDRLLAESVAAESKGKKKREKPQKIKTKKRKDEVIIRDESAEENETRRQRRRRLAAAGAVAGTVAILSQNDDEDNANQGREAAAPELTQDQVEALSLALAGMTKGAYIPLAFEKTDQVEDVDSLPKTPAKRQRALPENYFQPIETIYFDSNQRVPAKKETDKLKELAEFVRNNEGYGLMLTGYTDNTGSLNYNLKLAEDRMVNVAEALEEEYGISKELIRYQSGGKVLRGTQKANSPQDRKVEVSLVLIEENED
jgi:outer membrane protein OmpA-like peptidoglycan-associated protein